QTGVQEHNAAAFSGALSTTDLLVFFADFGVFGIDETYNQQRLNDINKTNLKVAVTHVGIDVGEDGKTHHCVDYIGSLKNLYHFKLIVPADPNQTDRAVRYIAKTHGNFAIAMGRSKMNVILKEDGTPFFDENYNFEYGKIDTLRDGEDGVLIVCGQLAPNSVEIWKKLKNEGINLRILNISSPLHPDVKTLKKLIENKDVFVYEDHNMNSGLGSVLADLIISNSIKVKSFKKFGLPDYAPSGSNKQLLKWAKLDVDSISKSIKEVLQG
ncbi:MAG TPA: transketolase, partial [Thermotogaceae bacterium]|nr:transketolase [Thermotogaceae bacterium]